MGPEYGVKEGEHVPGSVMHDYLKAYAHRFDLLRRIDFDTEVSEVSRMTEGQGWSVLIHRPRTETIETRKLIIATGVTNEPHRPSIDGINDFAGAILHSAELGT